MALSEPDWALWRSFAAVVADGSLSAAARRIGYSQPTLGRHIETLEQQLGVTLFDRSLQGLKPTPTALRLYESVQVAEAKLAEATLVAEGTIHCPCHEGYFELASGRPVAGPPRRPLTRVHLELRAGDVYATGVEERTT